MHTLEITHVYYNYSHFRKYLNRSLLKDHYGNQMIDKRFIYYVYHLYSIGKFLNNSKIKLSPNYEQKYKNKKCNYYSFANLFQSEHPIMKKSDIIASRMTDFYADVYIYNLSFENVKILEKNIELFCKIQTLTNKNDKSKYSSDKKRLKYKNENGILINTSTEFSDNKFSKPKNIDTQKQLENRIKRLYKKKEENTYYKTILDWYCHIIINLTNLNIPTVEKRMFELM